MIIVGTGYLYYLKNTFFNKKISEKKLYENTFYVTPAAGSSCKFVVICPGSCNYWGSRLLIYYI